MKVTSYRKGSTEAVGKYFEACEFDCPCKHPECDQTLIADELVRRLDVAHEILGAPVHITSGYRCGRYQVDLGLRGYETAKDSTHPKGWAADFMTRKHTGEQLEFAARRAGFRAVGRGRTWVHGDIRDDRDRSWSYLKR